MHVILTYCVHTSLEYICSISVDVKTSDNIEFLEVMMCKIGLDQNLYYYINWV